MNDTTRRHYSKTPINAIDTKAQTVSMKPCGLWYSVEGPAGNHWREWCEVEHFDGLGQHVYTLDINFDDVLVIDGEHEFDWFDRKFSMPYSCNGMPADMSQRMQQIDWPRVATEFSGIEIVPYLWSKRMNVFWYYGWDCASGCIWHSRAVASFTVEVHA